MFLALPLLCRNMLVICLMIASCDRPPSYSISSNCCCKTCFYYYLVVTVIYAINYVVVKKPYTIILTTRY